MLNIRPYLSEQPGHNNGAALPEKDPSIDEYGVSEEKTDTQEPLSSESKRIKASGSVRFKLADGMVFEGTLKDGKREGYGTVSSKSGDTLFRGEYANNPENEWV